MSRIVSASNATELAKDSIRGCVMVDLDFASGHLYLNDGLQETVYNSNTYSPIGKFGGIDAIDEGIDTIARPIKLTLSGCDPGLVGTAETEIYQNRSVIVYLALIDQHDGTLIAAPEVAWEGRMDYMDITLDQNLAKITLNCEHRLRREPRIARYTDADQQTSYAGDIFFKFVPQIVGFKAQWGNATVDWGGPSGGGGGRGGGGPGHDGGGRR